MSINSLLVFQTQGTTMPTKADEVLALADQIKVHREIVAHLEALGKHQIEFVQAQSCLLSEHRTKGLKQKIDKARKKLLLTAVTLPVKKILAALPEPVTEEE